MIKEIDFDEVYMFLHQMLDSRSNWVETLQVDSPNHLFRTRVLMVDSSTPIFRIPAFIHSVVRSSNLASGKGHKAANNRTDHIGTSLGMIAGVQMTKVNVRNF